MKRISWSKSLRTQLWNKPLMIEVLSCWANNGLPGADCQKLMPDKLETLQISNNRHNFCGSNRWEIVEGHPSQVVLKSRLVLCGLVFCDYFSSVVVYTDVEPPMPPLMCSAVWFHMYMRTTWDVKWVLLYEVIFQKITVPLRASKRKAALEGHIIPHSPAGKQYLCIARWLALVWCLSTSAMQIQKENVSSSSGQTQVKERKNISLEMQLEGEFCSIKWQTKG